MTAEIIAVGTELLLGDIVNTNAAFLAQELAKLGIDLYTQTVVGDNPKRLKTAYQQAYERGADLIITTGGLGPTQDDITKEVAAEYFGLPLVLHEETWENMQALFAKIHPHLPIATSNKKQAMLPKGCHILPNNNGTAPGVYISQNRQKIIMLPGPPNELEPMFLQEVVPILQALSDKMLISRIIKVVGVGESLVEQKIKHLITAQNNPTIAPYAKTFEVWLRLTAAAANAQQAESLINPIVQELYNIFGNTIFGENDDTLESVVIKLLKQQNLWLACAESCTGGMLAARLVNQSGASAVLKEGIVSYANESKINRLAVDKNIIKEYGAVSAEVAAAMAEGLVAGQNNLVGISTTGIAGPDGGTPTKPVGRVYIGLTIPNKPTQVKELNLTGDRTKIRTRAVIAGLDFLRLALLEK
ncbi:MAG: competence/damage-inducible protein A [Defluviitaleaceae bacterium]|nr:competence/damage-inducible protein A [Defluviitaleaceae bacterium]